MENREIPSKAVQEDKFLNALADAYRLQEAIINSTQLAIVTTSPDGIINSFNSAAENLLGYSSVDLIERHTPLIYHDLEEVVKRAEDLSRQTGIRVEPVFEVFTTLARVKKGLFREQWTLIKKNGNRFPAIISFDALHDEEQNLVGYIAIAEDITEQKRTEDQLRRTAEENFHVFNNPVNLNAVAGFDGYFKRLSPSWQNVLGWTEQELKEKPFLDFVHPDDVTSTMEAAAYIAEGNNLHTFENRYRCKDGSYKWLLWGSASDIHNKVIYASAIDITERKKSENKLIESKRSLETLAAKLQEQNRQLDEFAHIISHNLRSPVGNIQALIKLLDDNSTLSDYKVIFDKIRNVSKNLSETMNDLMDTMKVRENTSVERQEVKFKEVLDKVVQSLEGDLIQAEASVTFDFNEASSLYYPKAYLESIFQNLLTNALKYRSADRRPLIHFETRKTNHAVELRVSDNGLGIDMEKFGDKLFGLHKTFHYHDEARGVGLFLIKTQVEAMGGTITAESIVDHGTTFIIHF
jgi:PAS domain S-box-containing protein